MVRIQSLAKFIWTINCIEKTKIKKKEARGGSIKKQLQTQLQSYSNVEESLFVRQAR